MEFNSSPMDYFNRPLSSASLRLQAGGGIDGSAELDSLLQALGEGWSLAANAPRRSGLAAYLRHGMNNPDDAEDPQGYLALTSKLIEDLSIWWSPQVYQNLPVLVPWCIRDRAARYDQGPENWSAPRKDGFLRDDNSIIKKLPLPVRVNGPDDHSYNGRKPWRGFTACHIWRQLPDGSIAGADPWLYSFVPNLVWLPSAIAPLSDTHGGVLQRLLQTTSLKIYRSIELSPTLSRYAEYAWERLGAPSDQSNTLDLSRLSFFDADNSFVRRRLSYLDMFIEAADEVLTTGHLKRKVISSRFTEGFPQLATDDIIRFRQALVDYRFALSS